MQAQAQALEVKTVQPELAKPPPLIPDVPIKVERVASPTPMEAEPTSQPAPAPVQAPIPAPAPVAAPTPVVVIRSQNIYLCTSLPHLRLPKLQKKKPLELLKDLMQILIRRKLKLHN